MRRVVTIGFAIATLGGIAACSSAEPVFNNEGGQAVDCMTHQVEEPGALYTDPAMRKTDSNGKLLAYYTANGKKSYCDGAPATDADKAWAQAYVDIIGPTASEKVSGVLG